MIASLSGTVAEKLTDLIVLETGGVGYGLQVTAEDFGSLAIGESAKLYVYEHIRENTHDLYGFTSLATKALFELLLTVNGVGPKMALAILSVGTSNGVQAAIASGDTKYLQVASGVGKRVAERIVVELKDKVGLSAASLDNSGILQSEQQLLEDEAVAALVSLGYSAVDAKRALGTIDEQLSTEQRVTIVLRGPSE